MDNGVGAPILLSADWPAPSNINVNVSTCEGGVSEGCFFSFNLGHHVGDNPEHVRQNRDLHLSALGKAKAVQWLQQVHGTKVVELDQEIIEPPQGDALYSTNKEIALAVLTADCLPVCFTNKSGSEIAIAHAGWRGLAAGVLENTVGLFSSAPSELLAWFGPAIGPCHFEVGEEVRQEFLQGNEGEVQMQIMTAFTPSKNEGKWMANLYELAKIRLNQTGLTEVYGGDLCTVCDEKRFYSYRRNSQTGRFATTIYIS